jgi:penicillin-binding protein 1A
VVPALPAVEYLSNLLLRDHGLNRQSFRGGAGAMVTTVRLSRSWSRDEFLSILAERADFGYGWRGVDAAAKGFFGKPAAELTLPEAALIASRVGDLRTDPWCEPADAVQMRNGILERMRNNDAISDTHYQDALTVALQLMPPPANSCQ